MPTDRMMLEARITKPEAPNIADSLRFLIPNPESLSSRNREFRKLLTKNGGGAGNVRCAIPQWRSNFGRNDVCLISSGAAAADTVSDPTLDGTVARLARNLQTKPHGLRPKPQVQAAGACHAPNKK
jgi:hypothetical protein